MVLRMMDSFMVRQTRSVLSMMTTISTGAVAGNKDRIDGRQEEAKKFPPTGWMGVIPFRHVAAKLLQEEHGPDSGPIRSFRIR
ncbi:hypothetical protein A7A09_010915 [Paracoccus methylarcula]|uniref:Uncharacterized protein n=1 Tax=Paracoccus methylarcula TaxID=72022 RepID=A0A422QWR0_9RHOB|nr:hypothetical protein A7A09_010915 [Paracoccus methylarcula]